MSFDGAFFSFRVFWVVTHQKNVWLGRIIELLAASAIDCLQYKDLIKPLQIKA
jgi:hypothetical protein